MIMNGWLLNGMERFLSRSTRSTPRRRKGIAAAAAAAVQILEQRMLLSATIPMESDFNPETTPILASNPISNLTSSIPFSTTGYGGPTGDVAGGMVGQTYNQSIFVGHLPGQQYNISVASGWTLPPGLQLQDASGVPATDGILTGVSRFRIASVAGASPTAPGQYNVAFLATSTANSAISDTVVYHFLIRPSASVFQGSVTTTMPAPAGDATALGFNSLVLPPGTVGLPYNATIKVTNGAIGSVALMTQLSGGNLASAVNLQQPVPGLVGGRGGNVTGVNQVTGNMLRDVIANVAGLKIKWSAKTSTISIRGIPTISVGGVNDPLLLKVTGPNHQTLYYNFALTHSPAQIAKAYGFSSVLLAGGIKGTGAGQTVAIFAVGDNSAFVSSTNPNFRNSDLSMFDRAIGLNSFNQPGGPVFLKVDQWGGTNYPSQQINPDPSEVPQDIQWVHALAPLANIVVIEASSSAVADAQAVMTLVANWNIPGIPAPSVLTSSFNADSLNSGPFAPNVTYVSSSGDFGPSGFGASNVVVAGYTQIKTTASGQLISEQAVNGGTMQTTGKPFRSGGGVDGTQPQPTYQQFIPNTTKRANPVSTAGRTDPDVSFNGSEVSGVAVYNSYENTTTTNFKSGGNNYAFGGSPWGNAWGTSIAAPSWAAIFAIANQGRQLAGQLPLDGISQTLPTLYSLANAPPLRSVGATVNQTTQKTTPVPPASGKNYYNVFAGLGSPIVNLLIPKLVKAKGAALSLTSKRSNLGKRS